MTKDYAKKRRSTLASRGKGRYSQSQQSHAMYIPAWAWMSVGLLLGLSLSALFYWKNHTTPTAHPKVVIEMENSTGSKSKATKNKKTTLANEANGSRFDFYTLLPNMTADTTVEENQSLASTKINATPLTENTKPLAKPSSSSFIIQAGSFRQMPQAEELKAKLAISGFEASIQTININDKGKWFRVTVGPYESKENAQSQQEKLEQAYQLHSVLIKNRV